MPHGTMRVFYNEGIYTHSVQFSSVQLLSCVQLCATPKTAAHQAPPSLGFSRQERWSGLPLPSPMHEREKSTIKITVSDKDLIQNWWRNKKLFRKTKVKRIQYHLTSFTTNVKWTYIVKKYKWRKKIYKINPKQLRKWQ